MTEEEARKKLCPRLTQDITIGYSSMDTPLIAKEPTNCWGSCCMRWPECLSWWGVLEEKHEQ